MKANNAMLVQVEVESTFVESRGGVSARGKPYEIHSQRVWVYLNSKFPKEMQVNVDGPSHALAVGMYEVDLLPALDVLDFGKLGIDARRLQFVKLAAAPAVKVA